MGSLRYLVLMEKLMNPALDTDKAERTDSILKIKFHNGQQSFRKCSILFYF